jgi:hypothetical protein
MLIWLPVSVCAAPRSLAFIWRTSTDGRRVGHELQGPPRVGQTGAAPVAARSLVTTAGSTPLGCQRAGMFAAAGNARSCVAA